MKIPIQTNKKKQIIVVRIATNQTEKIGIQLSSKYKQNTYYTNRQGKVNGERMFYIRLPQSPKEATLRIWNVRNGERSRDGSFKILSVEQKPLKSQVICGFIKKDLVNQFVRFAQAFSERAAQLEAGPYPKGTSYQSNNGKFRIDYFDTIISRKSGKELSTPARISKSHGYIEVAKDKFLKYTVPMRMAILLHEFSHYFINDDQANEEEADLNALMIYLGLGYPKIEAHQAFLTVFKNTPSDQNVQRHKLISKFINNFDKIQWKSC